MDRMLYVAMNGANQVLLRQATNNHNLANLNTVGFRADLDTFVSKDTAETEHQTRVYAMRKGGAISNKQGDIFTTGRALDIAIDREGYIAVEDIDGSEGYTRGGQFSIGPGGLLQTNSGYTVMGDGGPIAIPPHESIQIAGDGSISIKAPGGAMLEIDRIKLVNIDNDYLVKGENGLLKQVDTPVFGEGENAAPAPAEADASVTVTAGALESSNVSSIEALSNMITLARQYEIQIKLMKSSEENEITATKMLNMS